MPDLHIVPSPATAISAKQLIADIRERGGRVFRMRGGEGVFALTTDPKLVDWLVGLGATPYKPQGASAIDGGFERARGGVKEWDVWLDPIKTIGEETIWEAAGASS